jgi:peptidoglycan-associated lipoprotein
MHKKIVGYLVVLSLAALFAGGCAKKDMVKPEETAPMVETAPPVTPEPVKPAPREAKPAPTEAPMTETPTQESAVRPETAPAQVGEAGKPGADLQSELQKIYFNFDSAALSDEARSALSKNAELLSKNSSVKVRIEGNCDERGSDEYNMALGDRRAKAAMDYLVNLGVQPDRLSTLSYGEEKPVDPGHDEAAWAKNRRNEFVIVK